MVALIIPILLVVLIFWAFKSRRYSDALFVLTVVACVFTFFKGFDLLPAYMNAPWQGVVLISVSLFVMLAAAISFRMLSEASNDGRRGTLRESKLAEQDIPSND